MTGGIVSLAIIITTIIAFINMIGDTLTKSTINYSQSIIRTIDPSKLHMKVSAQDNFMFGITLTGYDLNQDYRVFDLLAN